MVVLFSHQFAGCFFICFVLNVNMFSKLLFCLKNPTIITIILQYNLLLFSFVFTSKLRKLLPQRSGKVPFNMLCHIVRDKGKNVFPNYQVMIALLYKKYILPLLSCDIFYYKLFHICLFLGYPISFTDVNNSYRCLSMEYFFLLCFRVFVHG